VIVVAVVVAVAAWRRSPIEAGVVAAVAITAIGRSLRSAVAVAAVAAVVALRAADVHAGLHPDQLEGYAGWATVAADPKPSGSATRVVLQIEGERFETWVRGRAGKLRVEQWHQGDVVWVDGVREALSAERSGRVAWQHVVGEFVEDVLGDRRPGRRLDVASNRVRKLIDEATSVLDADIAALARGLIIGDDGDQPAAMTQRFRKTGLSHLTAVSGQNLALVLAVAGPLLRRARPLPRLAATVALIAWFVVLTRAEPSVLRSGVMASLAAIAFTLGREREPARLLALAVIVLLIVDPLLVLSVGFWLSVGATAGVTMIGPPLRRRIIWLGRLATPLAMTLGAQAGVAIPSVFVFGRLSFVGTFANLVAIPVAGLVMLYGLPASVVAGALPSLRSVLMLPVGLGTSWVDAVARVAAALEPRPPWSVIGWIGLTVAVACSLRRVRGADDDVDGELRQ
jgi:competence protein ComEC